MCQLAGQLDDASVVSEAALMVLLAAQSANVIDRLHFRLERGRSASSKLSVLLDLVLPCPLISMSVVEE